MLFDCRPKILHKHCLQFLLGVKMAPRETENNAYAKFWRDKQRTLWYVMVFLEWSIRPGFETVSAQHAARAQQRSYLFHAESFSTTPKSSKEKKGAAGRVIHGNVAATLSRKCRREMLLWFYCFSFSART